MLKLDKHNRFYFTDNDTVIEYLSANSHATNHPRVTGSGVITNTQNLRKISKFLYVVPGWQSVTVFSSRNRISDTELFISEILIYSYDVRRMGWILRGVLRNNTDSHRISAFWHEDYCELLDDRLREMLKLNDESGQFYFTDSDP